MKYSSNELKKFSLQIRYALDNYTPHGIDKDSLNAVLICGAGPSGVAGSIIKNYFADKIDVPVDTVPGYALPRYAGRNTLVIIWSYAGDNEEALAVYDIARERECRIIAISGGGQLAEKAGSDENILYPAEQAAIAFPLTYIFQVFFELLGQHKKADLVKIADAMEHSEDYIKHSGEIAGRFSQTLQHKFIVVCDPWFEGAATRFCQQISENAASEAFVSILPGAGYHATESYSRKRDSNYIFLNSRQNQRTNLQFSHIKELLGKYGIEPTEILITDTSLNSLFHVIHLLDWLSVRVAEGLGRTSGGAPGAASGQTSGAADGRKGAERTGLLEKQA